MFLEDMCSLMCLHSIALLLCVALYLAHWANWLIIWEFLDLFDMGI